MAVSKQPTITPETSSGEGLDEEPSSRGEAKWKRFHPLRVVRKIFRRRIKREGGNVVSDSSKKSWSTSELQSVQDDNRGKCEVTSPLKIGLSVSHDSIFSPENNSNIVSNETLEVPHGSSLSVRHTSMKNMFKDELFIKIRARRDSEDDGIGMQSSPYSSPTTVDILNQGFKGKIPKSQTTCSAGSLLSMGSSENDEDSTGQSSGHSSRMSLLDRRSLDSEAEEGANPIPLNHTAAHHKIAVRPKRTHGLPRRRMKQVAATKVSSLPSTPEVTEDLSKCLQQLQITEIIKSASEFSTVMEFTSTSLSTTEKHTSLNSTTVSCNETSDFISDIQEDNRSFNESSPPVDVYNWNNTNSNIKQELPDFIVDKHTFNKNEIPNEEGSIAEQLQKNTYDIFSNCKQTLDDKNQENEIESYKLIKSTFQGETEIQKDYIRKTKETTMNVASFVKSIEKSDSFKTTDISKKMVEGTEYNCEKKPENNLENMNMDIEESKLKNFEEIKVNSGRSTITEEFSESTNFTTSKDRKTSLTDSVNDTFKKSTNSEKLDIESEFVFKPLKKDRRFSNDSDSSFKDPAIEKQKDNSLVSSVYLEEESIMSNKSLSLGMEESRIFVSHHTYGGNLNDILVTEAHNYAAVDKKSDIPNSTSDDLVSNRERGINEPYISSVGISASKSSEKSVEYNSSLSALSDKIVSDDKITISVNSKSNNFKSNLVSPKNEDTASHNSFPKNSSIVFESNNVQKIEEKQIKPLDKSYLPDIGSHTIAVKGANSQKRVSVEIVPFSQRMKERKYQPISFTNKECSSENKKNSSVLVERKLSDRTAPKSKDSEKTNNRHSFSGTISSENKKEDVITVMKDVKKEKIQYPVQIRIHKSNAKPDQNDKNNVSPNACSEFKNSSKDKLSETYHQINSSKIIPNEFKFLREENKTIENTPKLEIKIQSAVSHGNNPQRRSNEENNASTLLQKSVIHRSESFKSAQFIGNENKDTDVEYSATKSQENTWKASKENSASLSDDPEPELLRVFARRSIKQKHCDKGKADELEKQSNTVSHSSSTETSEKSEEMISISLNSTVIKISENSKSHITKPDLKKKSKSFCEKEKIVSRPVSPLKEMNLIQRDSSLTPSEILHPRQRLVKVDDVPLNLPPESEMKNVNRNSQSECIEENSLTVTPKEEQMHRSGSMSTPPSTSVNGNFNLGMVKENQDVIAGKDAHTPSWLQLAQQRRELREQRERLLLGGSPNSFMDGSNKPSRSSKVWDMVNNFQKLQMT